MAAASAHQTTENTYNPLSAGPFNAIPRIIDRRRDLTDTAKRVYGFLAGCYGRDGKVFPTIRRIAFELGKGERQVSAALDELRRKDLIRSVRTGRASYYYFTPLDAAAGRSARPCLSPAPELRKSADHDLRSAAEQPTTTPLDNKKAEKTTTAAVVVSLPDPGELRKALDQIRPDVQHTKSIRRTIRQGIADHGLDAVLEAIAYTNERSSSHYGAYLAAAIRESWAEGWTPKATPPPEKNAAISAAKEARETAAFEREQAERIEAREEAARNFAELSDTKKKEIRERFLAEATPFTRRRTERLDLDALGASMAFLVWFADL